MIKVNWRDAIPWMNPKYHGAGIDWRLMSKPDDFCWVTSSTGEKIKYVTESAEGEGNCLKNVKFFSFAMLQPGQSYMPHDHSHEEVYYINKGKGTIRGITADKTEDFPIRDGTVIVTPIGEKHQLFNDGDEVIEFIAWAVDRD